MVFFTRLRTVCFLHHVPVWGAASGCARRSVRARARADRRSSAGLLVRLQAAACAVRGDLAAGCVAAGRVRLGACILHGVRHGPVRAVVAMDAPASSSCACVRACVRACVGACVRACVRRCACVGWLVRLHVRVCAQ